VLNGNTNGDEARDLSDVVFLLAWLFQGSDEPVLRCAGAPDPEICDGLGVDEDGDGATDCFDQDCADSPNCYVEGGTGLPDTGLRSCYTIDRRLTPCPSPGEAYHGQDGSYDTGCGSRNRFTDNGDGTVFDECTGLTWQRVDDGVRRLWCDALVCCESLSLGGETDWRMPNIVELESLVHYGFLKPPMIDPIFEDTQWTDPGVGDMQYWTSTSKLNGGRTNDPPQTYVVEFNEGSLHHIGDKPDDEWLVRAVRGP
jgi:hypothetical protein